MSGAIVTGFCWIVLMPMSMAVAVKALEWREKYLYWKARYKKQNGIFVEKEKKITYLKGEVKALAWANGLMQDLEEMEELLEETNKELEEAREHTPEWYKDALLEKIGELRELEGLYNLERIFGATELFQKEQLQKDYDILASKIKSVSEESNAELVAKNVALETELHNVCGKIDTLRQQYSAYLEDKALRMPDTMPVFGQIAEPEEQKPVDEHDVFEASVPHQPAEDLQEAVSGC